MNYRLHIAKTWEQIKIGGQKGRALYLRLHLMSEQHYCPAIEEHLAAIFPEMPEDDQAILSFVIDEIDRAYHAKFFAEDRGT